MPPVPAFSKFTHRNVGFVYAKQIEELVRWKQTFGVSSKIHWLTDSELINPPSLWRPWKKRILSWTDDELAYFYNLEQNTPEWLEARKNFTGSSALGSFTGQNRNTTPRQAVRETLNYYNSDYRDESVMQELFDNGHTYEPIVKYFFSGFYEKELVDVGIVVNNDLPYLGASCDALIVSPKDVTNVRQMGVFEAKFHKYLPMHHVHNEYQTQVHMQMQCTGRGHFYLGSCWFPETPGTGEMNVFHGLRDNTYFWARILPRYEEMADVLVRQDVHYVPKWTGDYLETAHTLDKHFEMDEELIREACAEVGVPVLPKWRCIKG